jgi:TrkA domain protein
MAEVERTSLPGVGVRYDFVTRAGERIGVLVHRTGRREILVYDSEDRDSCRAVIRLEPGEATTLTELLGTSQISEQLAAMQQIEGLAIDWLSVAASSACADRSLRDSALRELTGVSIVAVVRGDETIPAPDPDFRLEPGDSVVAVGTAPGIAQLFALLQGS